MIVCVRASGTNVSANVELPSCHHVLDICNKEMLTCLKENSNIRKKIVKDVLL